MIQSMTGFAAKTIELMPNAKDKVSLAISIKTLNSRFFEVNCKMPYALSHLETDLIKRMKKKVAARQCVFGYVCKRTNTATRFS